MKPAPDVYVQEIEGELVLLDANADLFYTLDDVGKRCWELLVEHEDPEQVVATMLTEFATDEATLRADVEAFLASVREAGLLVPEG